VRAILTYHSIDPSGSPISVAVEEFQRHVKFLASGKVRVVPLAEVQSAREEHVVAITFDDGACNFATQAWPLLREHGFPATLFVVSGQVGKHNDWQGKRDARVPHLKLLDWEALGSLSAEGLELGAHSRTHPHLTKIPDSQLDDEIEGCAEDFQRHAGERPNSYCYPYGSLDERAVSRVARHYRSACTTELAALGERDSQHRLPRLDAYYLRGEGRLEAWGGLGFQTRIKLLCAARAVRSRLS
jgi:peptidoglycan/xylan/chitin deacetylase (PgdA/CDA1 family)